MPTTHVTGRCFRTDRYGSWWGHVALSSQRGTDAVEVHACISPVRGHPQDGAVRCVRGCAIRRRALLCSPLSCMVTPIIPDLIRYFNGTLSNLTHSGLG